MCEHDKIICPEHDGGYDCTPFCNTCEGEQEYCKLCDFEDTILHCDRPVEWVLHEHAHVLDDPCYAWVCMKCGTASQYDCEEVAVNA